MRIIASYFFSLLFLFIPDALWGQSNYEVIDRLLQVPRQYTVMKTSEKIVVDGLAKETAWSRAPYTDNFVDITGRAEPIPLQKTSCKMLWDDEYLFVFALFHESDIWATYTEHDAPIYHDNAFEIFFDPDGDGRNYMEFQINANEAVFDFLFAKPFRSGGKGVQSWQINGLKKAVYVDGTLNNPSDKDKSWSIELAIPLKSLTNANTVSEGDIWRVNLSRVQWDTEVSKGVYQKKRDNRGRFISSYWVWSPQGLVNLHYPERWGYVRFGNSNAEQVSGFLRFQDEQLKLEIWKYYYLQQDYKIKHGKYALNAGELEKTFPKVKFPATEGFFMRASEDEFEVGVENVGSVEMFSIDQDGRQINTRRG